MTVAELRRALAPFPADTDVCVFGVAVTALAWMDWSPKAGWDHVAIVVSGQQVKLEQPAPHEEIDAARAAHGVP